MKKNVIICLLIGLIYTPSALNAFELPAVLEPNITDDLIQAGGKALKFIHREGHFSCFYKMDYQPNSKPSIHERAALQLGAPWYKTHRALGRIELDIAFPLLRAQDWFVMKFGPSGRYILNPNLIAGGYCFLDSFHNSLPKMLNVGLEFAWPKYYGLMLAIDSVFNYESFTRNYNNKGYQGSIKLSLLKPKVFDAFTGFSITKHPLRSQQLCFIPFGIKLSHLTSHWKLNKISTVGIKATYVPQEKWIAFKNFGVSGYVEFHTPSTPTNSLQDYLRMPIDRLVATPYHPGFSS